MIPLQLKLLISHFRDPDQIQVVESETFERPTRPRALVKWACTQSLILDVRCGKQFITEETLREQTVEHDTFTCDICQKDVAYQRQASHTESHHGQELFNQTLENGRLVRNSALPQLSILTMYFDQLQYFMLLKAVAFLDSERHSMCNNSNSAQIHKDDAITEWSIWLSSSAGYSLKNENSH